LIKYKYILQKINDLKISDSLLFIPSSHINRFYDQNGFVQKLPDFPKNIPLQHTPKAFCEYCKKKFSLEHILFAPFSVKKTKSKQINSLIFMSKHPLGLDKFLQVTWKNSQNGEAGFTVNGDLEYTGQLSLLAYEDLPSSKLSKFQILLEREILLKKLKTSKDVYLYTLEKGFLPPKHAKPVLKKLYDQKIIKCNPGVSYNYAFKTPQNLF